MSQAPRKSVDGCDRPMLIMMCGLPASGKTTSSARLHASLGGVLIRSCDIYQELGIVVSEWVQRTKRFTAEIEKYNLLRDKAYLRMAGRAKEELEAGNSPVIIDFAHPDLEKRCKLYEVCLSCGATPVIVLCQCNDLEEVQRRFCARRGREAEPENEASDLSVFEDMRRRWQSPLFDVLSDGNRPTIIKYDTVVGSVTTITNALPVFAERIRAALEVHR